MESVVDLWRAEGKAQGLAQGKAEGKAEAAIELTVALVRDGDLAPARARVRLQQLAEQGILAPAQLAGALAQLGS